jgi:gamma-glutamylaminecyclotransferase
LAADPVLPNLGNRMLAITLLEFAMDKVFIYGTLKGSFAFHELGLAGAGFLGRYQTAQPYPLYIAMPFYGPMMLDRPGEGLVVQGEVYEADEERLQLIDGLEDVGKPGSFRSTIMVETAGGAQGFAAVAYFKDESWLNPLHSDTLSDYQDRRFIPPWDR